MEVLVVSREIEQTAAASGNMNTKDDLKGYVHIFPDLLFAFRRSIRRAAGRRRPGTNRVGAVAALTAALVLFCPGLALAAPGDLDPTFGTGGKVTTDFGGGLNEFANAVVVQTDGKIIAVGGSDTGLGSDFALARYNTNGSLDTTFGTGGKVTTDFGGTDAAFGVVVQPNGKIVTAGYSDAGGTASDFALARYNTDGSLDTTFGTGGKVTTDFGTGRNDVANGVALQTNGKIVAVGSSALGTANDFALARYNTNGSLDTAFGTGGKVITDFGGDGDIASAVALQTNGQIVAAGLSNSSGTFDFALARYNTNGSLDPTFGTGGTVTTSFGGTNNWAFGVKVQSDGKIVAAGFSNSSGSFDFALARYNTNGSLDPTFGTGGTVTTDFGGFDIAFGVAVQTNGQIVVAGYSDSGGTFDFALARYNTNGSLDPTFGTGGKVTTDFGGFDAAFAVALQADGKIVAAGSSDSSGTSDFALARYMDGTPSLTIDKSHTGDFTQGDQGVYTITVGNSGPASTNGSTVTVQDTLPAGLTTLSITGPGWHCTWATLTCTRSDVLADGDSYPPITLRVNVSCDAPSYGTNTATVTGGGDSTTHTAEDPTTINPTECCVVGRCCHPDDWGSRSPATPRC
ncbi:calcium-binding protein [Streptomyces sp. NPDC097981]|uniref:calcium-binding protein n=1 Tax=Streptomyces sp. NPDC097981 TaxID=3155428 RepID=UPI003333307E